MKTLHPSSKFRVFAPLPARTRPMRIEYSGLVNVVLSPEHSESRVVVSSLEELLLALLPEHSESRTVVEAGEVLLALLSEHTESMSLVIPGIVSVNFDVTAELSFSLGIPADLVFSLVPEAVSSMTSMDDFFKAYSAILYRESVTATLMPTHPRIVSLVKYRVGA